MRIELDIPDWTAGKHLYLLAGIELVAYKYLTQPWRVKAGRCNMCGACCEDFKRQSAGVIKTIDGRCIYLLQEGEGGVCSLGSGRPFSCCVGVRPKGRPGCSEAFE